MVSGPTISVVIPLYNHERYIEAALRSVLGQTSRPFELVLIDDGSSDSGYEIASDLLRTVPYARCLRQDNAGAHHAINRAIELSTGSHIAVLNSDDLFKPYKLERSAKIFLAKPDIDLLFGRVEIIDSSGHCVSNNETTEWLERAYSFWRQCDDLPLALLNENFAVTTSNFVFSRNIWNATAGFKNLRYCHDLEFLMAAARLGKLFFDDLGGPHIAYRIHPSNTIKESLQSVHLEIAAVIASALEAETLGFDDALAPISKREQLEGILARKGLAPKVASLVPYRRSFDRRHEFFDEISANVSGLKNLAIASSKNAVNLESKVAAMPRLPPEMTAVIELSNFDKGGLEKVVLDCAIDLRRCGVEPIIVSCGEIGHLGSVARAQAIETVQLPSKGTEKFYENFLKSRKIDISMSHFSNCGYKIFRKLGIPNITFIHNVYAMLRDQALRDFLDADKFVDRYISVSALATDYAVDRLGLSRTKVETIPNGLIIDEHLFRESHPAADRVQFGVKDTDYLFLNVASYNLHKAHYLMADAMRLIIRKRDDIKILCVGNVIYPPHIEQLKADLKEWGLSNHILMPGYFEDVAPLHKASDAFLLPSLIEGWSIAMNEAMFYGKPMILTETGGAPEVIIDSDIGILVPNEYGAVSNLDSFILDEIGYEKRRFQTAPYLANAMVQFADNREKWRSKGQNGRNKIITQFDFSKITDRYVAICRDVLKCSH